MELIDLYKTMVEEIGLVVTEDNYIKIPNLANKDVKPSLWLADGLPIVLPTKEHLDTAIVMENGSSKVVKVLFNPLREDVLKGDSIAIKKVKYIIEKRLAHSFAMAGVLLLTLAANPSIQSKINIGIDISKLLGSLQEAMKTGVKKLVDPNSITNWSNLYKNSLNPKNKDILSIVIAKPNARANVKFCRTATLYSPLLDSLLTDKQEEDVNTVFSVNLRNKDKTIFRLITTFLLGEELDKHNTIKVVSEDGLSPATISLYNLYTLIGTRLNKIIKDLYNVDEDVADSGLLPINVLNKDTFNNVEKYKPKFITIPTDLELSISVKEEKENKIVKTAVNKPLEYVTKTQSNNKEDKKDVVHMFMYGGSKPQSVAPVQILQPIPQQPIIQQPQQVIPQVIPNIVPQQQIIPQPIQQPMVMQQGYTTPQPYQHTIPQQQIIPQPIQQPMHMQPIMQQPVQQMVNYPQQNMVNNYGIRQPMYNPSDMYNGGLFPKLS